MEQQNDTAKDYEELSKLYLFDEIYQFAKTSTGLAISTAYLILILSSLAYLYVFYHYFDINIVKFITLEDVLAAPLKSPDIILIFTLILFVLYLADLGNRFRANQQIKYANTEKPLSFKILQVMLWAPRKKQTNIKVTITVVVVCLIAYVYSFATIEAKKIKKGEVAPVELVMSADDSKVKTNLLGTTTSYIFTYDKERETSLVYYVEAITSLKPLKIMSDDIENKSIQDETIEQSQIVETEQETTN